MNPRFAKEVRLIGPALGAAFLLMFLQYIIKQELYA